MYSQEVNKEIEEIYNGLTHILKDNLGLDDDSKFDELLYINENSKYLRYTNKMEKLKKKINKNAKKFPQMNR